MFYLVSVNNKAKNAFSCYLILPDFSTMSVALTWWIPNEDIIPLRIKSFIFEKGLAVCQISLALLRLQW